jgi:hypothetical protein
MENGEQDIDTLQRIQAQEDELTSLLIRVMEAPLAPLKGSFSELDRRLRDVEEICRETRELDLPSVQAEIRKNGEELRKFKTNLAAIRDDVEEMLSTRIAVLQQELTELHGDFGKRLGELQIGQASQNQVLEESFNQYGSALKQSAEEVCKVRHFAQVAALESGKAAIGIVSSHENLSATLKNLNSEAHLESDRREKSASDHYALLLQTTAQVGGLAPTVERRVSEIKEAVQREMAEFQTNFAVARAAELAQLKLTMHQRVLWLSVVCGLSVACTAWLVGRSFW